MESELKDLEQKKLRDQRIQKVLESQEKRLKRQAERLEQERESKLRIGSIKKKQGSQYRYKVLEDEY